MKLNGTSFGECEIFDTGQIVCRRTLFRRTPVTKASGHHISRIIVYGRAIGEAICESATSKAGIISKLSGRRYRSSRALITEQFRWGTRQRPSRAEPSRADRAIDRTEPFEVSTRARMDCALLRRALLRVNATTACNLGLGNGISGSTRRTSRSYLGATWSA